VNLEIDFSHNPVFVCDKNCCIWIYDKTILGYERNLM